VEIIEKKLHKQVGARPDGHCNTWPSWIITECLLISTFMFTFT